MSDLSLDLPGIWTWVDPRAETQADAIERVPESALISSEAFKLRLMSAASRDVELLAICIEFAGALVDLHLELGRAPRPIDGDIHGLEAAAWSYSFAFGRAPSLDELVEARDGRSSLRFQHHDYQVSYVRESPDDDAPALVTFFLGERITPAVLEFCDMIIVTSTWVTVEPSVA